MKLALIDLDLLDKKIQEARETKAIALTGLVLVKNLTESIEPYTQKIFKTGYNQGISDWNNL